MSLADKKCVPCQGGEPTLKKEEIQKFLVEIGSGWEYKDFPDRIIKEYKFKDFKEALTFVNKVGALAEDEGHHPDIHLVNYNRVKVETWTHKIGGLHENDFILASKIEKLGQ